MTKTHRIQPGPGTERSHSARSAEDSVGDRHTLLLIGMVAVSIACLIFAVTRLAMTLKTGRLTPWWVNAAGLAATVGLYLWYRRYPLGRNGIAANGTALVATLALLVPIAYGMTSTVWWLSLVGFAMVLLGRRREALVWGVGIPLVVAVAIVVEPRVRLEGAAGEPFLETVLAKTVFAILVVALAAAFRSVAERRAIALHDSQADLKRLTDNMVDVISEVDLEGRTQFVSPSHELVTGWTSTELIGANALDLVHPDDREMIRAKLARGAATGEPGSAEYRYRVRDGRYIWVETASNVLNGPDGKPQAFVLGSRDVTARKRAEAVLGVLHETERRILRHEPIDRILEFICNEVASRFEFAVVWVGIKEPDGSISQRAVAGPAASFVRESRFRWDDLPEGRGSSGEAIRSGLPANIATKADARVAPWQGGVMTFQLESALSIPLVVGESVLGVLSSYSDRPNAYGQETTRLLTRFADQASLALVEAGQHDQIELQTAALEAAANAVLITDREGRIEWVNPAFTALTGWRKEEVFGKTPRILRSDVQAPYYYENLWRTIVAGDVWRGELLNRRKDGTVYAEEQTITPVRSEAGEIRHFISIKQDVTARKAVEQQIEYNAYHDSLTTLPNRQLLRDRLDVALAQSRRTGRGVALLSLDLDRFKLVNDSIGHVAGDAILREVASRLTRCVREGDTVARISGDEFAIFLSDVTDEGAVAVARQVLETVDHTFEVGRREVAVTTSIGIAVSPRDGTDAEKLLNNADIALRRAKESGGNAIELSTPALEAAAKELSSLHSGLRRALDRHEFVLHYQSVVSLRDGHVAAVEALLRWGRDPGAPPLGPSRFLAVAEESRLIIPIGRWVLEQACHDALRWHEMGHRSLRVAVNVSARQIQHGSLVTSVRDVLRESGFPPESLVLEITESTAMENMGVAIATLTNLREMGVRLALDDFGTGHSSLAYLKRFPVHTLKIDQAFVRGLGPDRPDRAIVAAVIETAHSLGVETVAEGVETAEELATLRELGCDEVQGYLFGRPVPFADAAHVL